jgi:hypothetical protein
MKITNSIIFLFIGSFIIYYFAMTPIMVSNFKDISNNIGKIYLASIMGILIVIVEVMIKDKQYNVLSINLYIILLALLIMLIYFYRIQAMIDNKQYIEGMIEKNSMDIFTSKEILKKTNDYETTKIAKNVIQNRTDEIRIMKNLANKI